jgi:nitrate/TMAO reductase-like tetraheme cytochrome c subunit
MKFLLWPASILLFASGYLVKPATTARVVLVAGDFSGQLTPCGCVKPMIGGVLRLATAVKGLSKPGKSIFVVNGAVTNVEGRQSELKAETLGEALAAMNCDAFAPASTDMKLGDPVWESVARLAKGSLLVSGSKQKNGLTIAASGPGGVLPVFAKSGWTVLLWDGDLDSLKRASIRAKQPLLAVFRSTTKPASPVKISANVWAVSPGDRGKYLLNVTLSRASVSKFGVVELGPQYVEDPAAKKIMGRYLARVNAERLLDRLPRMASPAFAGSNACVSCHADSADVWKKSAHAGALKTLEKVGHDRDPDCVGCHVVGLDFEGGFTSRAQTNELSDVGCESCHGPGAAHVADAKKESIRRSTLANCVSCHNLDHSPGFDAQKYWQQIRH